MGGDADLYFSFDPKHRPLALMQVNAASITALGGAPGPVLGCYGRVCAILRLLAQWEPSKTSNYRISKTNPKLDVAGSILHFAQIKATRLQLQFKSF